MESLLNETRKLLRNRTESLEDIADAAGVGLSWLQKMAGKGRQNPRVQALEQLNRYLKKSRQ